MHYAQVVAVVASMLLASVAVCDESQKGLKAFQSADYETALAIWQPLAEAGDANSQFGLGQMYGSGVGVAMDDALAVKWYSLAAAQSHVRAQLSLAVIYQNGWGVTQSDEEAMRLYGLAAEQGNSVAMVALGQFMSVDYLDSYDPVQAYKWFVLAVMLNDHTAFQKRDDIVKKLTAEQKAEGDALIAAWSEGNAGLLASD